MTNIKRSTKTFFEVTLPDFFLPHYVSRWDAIKSHVQAYINLIFLVFLVMGFLYATNYKFTLERNVTIVSPVVEVEGK